MALCPEFDIASQGNSIEEARDNLRKALELFFECAPQPISKGVGATASKRGLDDAKFTNTQ